MTTTNYAVAPGEYLEEWIEQENLTQQQAADLLDYSRKHVNELVHGRASVTPDTANRLERVTQIPAEAWLRYEAQYRADLARIADEQSLAAHVEDIDPTAATYLRDLGATTATRRQPGRLVSDFLSFHRCGTWPAYEQQVARQSKGEYALASLKESRNRDVNVTALTSWLRAGERSAAFEEGRRGTYNEQTLRNLLPQVRERSSRPDATMLTDIAALLSQAGVILLVVRPPAKFPLYGVTRWIDERVPVIQQSGRRQTDGYVTWTLFHEIGHVLNDPRGEVHLEFSTAKKRNSAAEKAANEFAFNTLFGPGGLATLEGLSRDGDIVQAARNWGISPGVVIHQLHRRRLLPHHFGTRFSVNLADTFTA